MDRATRIGVGAAILTEALYGGSFVFTKGATDLVDPFTLLGWRFTTALAILLLLAAARLIKIKISRDTLKPLLVLALLQPVVYYTAETYAVMRTTASESALIISAIPVTMLLTAALVVGVRPTRRQVAGISVTLAGVLITVLAGGLSARLDAGGYALLLGAVVAFAFYAAFADRYAHTRAVDRTFVMVAVGSVVFGALALSRHGAAGTVSVLLALPLAEPTFGVAVLFLALGPTIGAFFMQNVAIRHLGATRFSTFIGLSTLIAVTAGAVVLGERLGWAQWLGGVTILGGVYLANRRLLPGTLGGVQDGRAASSAST